MTLPEFLTHLDAQPWKFDYIKGLLTLEHTPAEDRHICYYISSTFSWEDTAQGVEFWKHIHTSTKLKASKNSLISDLISALRAHYSSTHPELFI